MLNPCCTCVKVVLCLRLAGVGQEDEGAWEGAWTEDMPPASPSVFSFLKAPSEYYDSFTRFYNRIENCIVLYLLVSYLK